MRQTKPSTRLRTGDGLRIVRGARSLAPWLLGVALFSIDVYGQNAPPASPRELLTSDPKAFSRWLEDNRPRPVSADRKAAILSSLPHKGEVKPRGAASQRKLAALNGVLQKTTHDGALEIKVTDVADARTALHERTFVLISEPVFTMLGVEELQALLAHEIGHWYLWADQAPDPAHKAQKNLKDLELLCDAVAIVMLRELEIDPSRLIRAIETITRYNRLFDREVEERTYPSLTERRRFAREVTAWLTRGSPPSGSIAPNAHSA